MKKQSENITDAALLRQKAEEKLSQRKPETKKMVSETDMLKMIHELEVHQIELEMQNEELTIAKEKAELAEEKYTELYDFAPSGYFTLSRHGIILEMNLHGAQMLGKERSLLINRRFGLFIKEDSRIVFANFLEEIFQGKNNATCDVPLSCEDNSSLYVHLTGIISDNKEQCRLTAIDITEPKRAEDELRKNLAKYQVLIDTFPIAITISDPEGNIVETNKKAIELLGLPREEHLKRKIKGEDWKIIRTDGTIFPQDEYASVKALNENRLVENIEMGIVKPNEEITWINVTAAPIPIEEFGVLIAYNDITRRKQMENALLENEERLRLALKATNDVIWDWDIINDLQQWNEAGKKVFGWTEIVENTVNAAWWMDRIHPDDRQRVEAGFYEAVNKSDIRWQDEYRFRKADGTYAEVIDRAYILRDNTGKAIRMIGAMLDITERKLAEKKLQESEENLSITLHSIGDGVITTDKFGMIDRMNPVALKLCGWHEDEIKGKKLAEVFNIIDAYTREPVHNPVEKVIENGEIVGLANHTVLVAKDGKEYQIADSAAPIKDNDGNIKGVVLVFSDVSEKYAAEEQIRFQAHITDNSPVITAYHDNELNMIWANKAYQNATGLSLQEIKGRKCYQVWNLSKPCSGCPVIKAIETGKNAVYELTPHNQEHWPESQGNWLSQATPVRDAQGVIIGAIEFAIDITERKQAELLIQEKTEEIATQNEELNVANQELIAARDKAEESEKLFKSLINNAPDGVVIIDERGKFKYVSPNAARLFGYNENEVMGHSGDEYTHPEDLLLISKTFETIINNPSQKPKVEYRFRRSNGEYHWIETTFSNLLSDDAINGFILNFTDVTERKQILEDLVIAKEIAEESEAKLKEAQRIAHLGNWALNIETNELFWSDEIYRIFDCKPHEIKATYEAFLEFIHPDDREKVNSAYLKSLETKTEYQIEHRIITKNNQLKYVKEKCISTFNEQGKPLSSFGIVIDITESKQAEMFAIKERAISDTIIDSTPGTFYMLDENGRYVRWNAYQRDEIVGKPDSMMPDTNAIDTIHPEDRDLIGSRIENVLKNGVAETVEGRVFMHGGPDFRWMIMTGRRIVIEEKPYLLGIGMDITDRKKAEQALMAKMEELERFCKLTVGREITMIELKKEVNDLLNKMGEGNKYNLVLPIL